MSRVPVILCAMSLLVTPSFGQPREWRDDFVTAATYDDMSLMAPCPYYGGGPSTKYTAVEGRAGGIYNSWAVSGGGRFRCSANTISGLGGRFDIFAIGAMNFGQGCPDVVGVTNGTSNVPFSSPDICVYAGWMWNNWQFLGAERPGRCYGVDAQPGFAGVDDDHDGTTDEANEYPGLGADSKPGVAGIDDDGINGADDEGETGYPGSDDSDDEKGKVNWNPALKMNINETRTAYLNWSNNEYAGGGNIWSIRSLSGIDTYPIAQTNEIVFGFFSPYVRYNYAFCVSGTCFGAQLWTEADMANPDETLGPAVNSMNTGVDATTVAFCMSTVADDEGTPLTPIKNYTYMGNQNFGDAFWAVSGPSSSFYPAPSADLDRDKDVDGFDFLTFSNCYNGSNKPALAACANKQADLDKDGDVDGFDFLTFSNCYNGSNRKPLAACFPPNLTACP